MFSTLKMPIYIELIGLSDAELIQYVSLALSQVNDAEAHHESTTEKTKIYQAYKNELVRRNYKYRIY